ncbi:MAG: gliding motility-associated C-terminal domain-containing protein, partial [Bacteroidales bacterium]
GIQTLNFKIYNRWGELVFETNDVSKGWDGTYKGQLLNPNVFVYYLNVAFYGDKKAVIQKGDISLVR